MSNFLPNELIKRLAEREGFDEEAFVDSHERGERITSIRVNPSKHVSFDTSQWKPVPWCENGYYLPERPVFTLDPFYHAGCFYVQEASSLFLDHILRYLNLKDSEVKALDVCAAPGGKSTLLNTVLGEDALLVSNEVIKSRANILTDNLIRWGNANVVVTNNDPTAFGRLPGYFDLMLVDAPCSGSGMFRKDREAVDEWSLANVKLCSDRQKRILADSLPALAKDGILLYSTCSYSIEENEEIVDWLMEEYSMESISIPLQENWGVEETQSPKKEGYGYRFYPHIVKGEGFFIAVFRKREAQSTFSRKKVKSEKNNVPRGEIEKWIAYTSQFTGFMQHDNIHIFPKRYELDLSILRQMLYLKNAGTCIGKWTGRALVPAHDLALSNYVLPTLFSQEVDLDTAQNYLRKENLTPDNFVEKHKGWVLVRYEGVNLGWVKVLSNRVNNYYPKEIRIMHL